jgi:hypothetical protein
LYFAGISPAKGVELIDCIGIAWDLINQILDTYVWQPLDQRSIRMLSHPVMYLVPCAPKDVVVVMLSVCRAIVKALEVAIAKEHSVLRGNEAMPWVSSMQVAAQLEPVLGP